MSKQGPTVEEMIQCAAKATGNAEHRLLRALRIAEGKPFRWQGILNGSLAQAAQDLEYVSTYLHVIRKGLAKATKAAK